MIISQKIKANDLELRCLSIEEVGETYLAWLNDPLVNQYLEVRHSPPKSVAELRQFVSEINASENILLLGMFIQNGSVHIGNIKLGPIDRWHHRADIGVICGERSEWGKGYATMAIRLLSDFAEQQLGLQRLSAGCYSVNKRSARAFEKAGFKLEATIQSYWQLSDGRRIDELWLGRVKHLSKDIPDVWNGGIIKKIIFVGGGMLMVRCMERARELGFDVGAFLAERHASQRLTDDSTLVEILMARQLSHRVLEDVDQVDPIALDAGPGRSLALCFGPAWIFPSAVIRRFDAGMLNFNGIPIPRYMGGAHYTWQILNNHRYSGCHIQLITDNIDRGDILLSQNFELPQTIDTPMAYFQENDLKGFEFINSFLNMIRSGLDMQRRSFSAIEPDRLYFPRLDTRENGWIDWSWSAEEILRFCNAFSSPYPGASTHYQGRRLLVKKISIIVDKEHAFFHPYCAGLIVRKDTDSFVVAVRNGLLRVESWEYDGNSRFIKVGQRLDTSPEQLTRSRLFHAWP